MSILSPSNLETTDYGQQGWNAILKANVQKINDLFSRLWALLDFGVAADGESDSSKLTRSNDSRLSDARTPTAHTHTMDEVATPAAFDFSVEYDVGTVSVDTAIDWNNANNQKITLGANVTLTFSNMGVGHKQLKVVQDSTGGRTATLPSGKWPGGNPGSFTTVANAEDILSIYYDGSNYYYQLSKGWA